MQTCARIINGVLETVPTTQQQPTHLFGLSNIHAPGVYQYNDLSYNCAEEGFYVWFNPFVDTTHRAIYGSDKARLIGSLSEMCVHGRSDEWMSIAQKNANARVSYLRMRCGATVEWIRAQLDSVGINSRTVRLLTGRPPNNYDDGHVALEVNIDGAWRLFDPANNYQFGGSLAAAIPEVADNCFTLNQIASHRWAIEPFKFGDFDATTFAELNLSTPERVREWVRRIYQIPGIDHTDGLTYFYLPPGMESRQSWVLGLSTAYRVVPHGTWFGMFYT